MSKELSTTPQKNPVKALMANPKVQNKFKEILGERSVAFITTVLQIVATNDLLQKADPISIYGAAYVAATLDLPINKNLGFAYIIPYWDKKSGKQLAQFQMGYKGFIQLAMRSGQFKTLSAAPVYESQVTEHDPLRGFQFDWENRKSDKIIGYAAFFALTNGFEKTLYMSHEDIEAHAKQYSQTYKKGFGLWKDNFEAMALKTVMKLLLSKYAPMSVEVQKTITNDGVVVKNPDTMEMETIDAEAQEIEEGVPFGDEEKQPPAEEEGTEGQDKLL